MSEAAASPADLRAFADTADGIDDAITRAGSRLTAAAAAWAASGPAYGSSVGAGTGAEVTEVARDWAYTTEWVRLVAARFVAADSTPTSFGVVVGDDEHFAGRIPPATEDEAEAEAAALADEWLALLDETGLSEDELAEMAGVSVDDAEAMAERFPELRDLLERVEANSALEPFSAAFVEQLGADGVTQTVEAIHLLGEAQFVVGTGDPESTFANADLSHDLLAPFDRVVLAGLDDDRNQAVADDLLTADTPREIHDLALLLAHGDGAPSFIADAAELVLRYRREDPFSRVPSPPSWNRLYVTDPALNADELLAIRILDRSPEAAFEFVTETDGDGVYTGNADLLVHPPNIDAVEALTGYFDDDMDDQDLRDEYLEAAGGAIEGAFAVWPESPDSPPGTDRAAADAFGVVVHHTGDGDVPDLVKRSIARVGATTLIMEQIALHGDDASRLHAGDDALWNVDDDVVRDFFQELAYDNDGPGSALEIISHGVGAYGQRELQAGVDDLVQDGELRYDHMADELDRVGSLWGNLGAGMQELNDDELSAEQRRDALLAGINGGGRALGGALITISPATGGTSAAAGLTVYALVEGGTRLGDSLDEPGLVDVDGFKDEARTLTYAQIEAMVEADPELVALLEGEDGDLEGPLATIFGHVDGQMLDKLFEAGA
ncbi:hypothetical protein HC251_02790 [Iamia sp. SCSIO 61187]|uniref:hypothetical protein n=1 Tax=Iamia sp. SCSIO 61187 TaxID=2722752 RepID=UPI001C63B176|nr:hypothetical protein [Iamia sp. SCSIO 61187]QYG91468.1 hypothetical protein HC251_02790 [Iamia sp. SCSIO 61187]